VENGSASDSRVVPRILRLTLAAACSSVLLTAPALAQDRAPAAGTSAASVVAVHGLEAQVLREINALRRSRGLVALRTNPGLAAAAAAHSAAMAQTGFFAHESPDGSPFWKRVKLRYGATGFARWSVGENLVWASPALSAKQAVTMWLNSPPHRKNLLSPQWREIGLGGVHALRAQGAFSGLDVTVLTADFGVRA
jgi:uncharacterized protein YkwD